MPPITAERVYGSTMSQTTSQVRGAERVGRFLQPRRHGQEHLAHHRGDERNDHDRQHDAGGQHADAERRPGEQRRRCMRPASPRCAIEPRIDVLGHERHEDEQAPHAVDDRRDAGQQFDRRGDRPAQPARRDFGQEQRDAETDRHRDEHRDQRGDQRAVDRHQRAELVVAPRPSPSW